MKTINRKTAVFSVSLSKDAAQKLEKARRANGQSRSAFIASLIEKETEQERWRRIYQKGMRTARACKITSEDDIDRLLHEN